jgi:hypothetical protein
MLGRQMLKIDDKSLSNRATNRRNFRRVLNFPPCLVNNRLLPEVSRKDRDAVIVSFLRLSVFFVFAVFCAAKIMKRLVSGQSQSFFFSILKAYGLINEALYKPRFTVVVCHDSGERRQGVVGRAL